MRVLARLARGVARALFVLFVVVVAAFPLPVMPIVLVIQKWRRREVAAQIDRRR